jgi:hypothetical protein
MSRCYEGTKRESSTSQRCRNQLDEVDAIIGLLSEGAESSAHVGR